MITITHNRIAVTGAAGFLGSHICRSLIDKGKSAHAVTRRGSNRPFPKDLIGRINVIPADVRDRDSLRNAFKGCDTVIHSAALLPFEDHGWDFAHAVNTQGVKNVVEACRQAGVSKIVHISSIHAFGPLRATKLNNHTYLNLESGQPYSASKAAGHAEVLAAGSRYGIDVDVISPSGLIGPWDTAPSAVGRMLLAIAGKKLPCFIKEGYWWCDVRDVADAAVAATQQPQSGAGNVYLTGGTYATTPELARLCSEIIGHNVSRPAVSISIAEKSLPFIKLIAKIRGDAPLYSKQSLDLVVDCPAQIDDSPARSRLGYAPRPLHKTIDDTLRWFIQNDMLQL